MLALAVACSDTSSGARDTPPNRFDTRGTGGDRDGGACVQDPAFFDVPGDGCDNDADGKVDDVETCDGEGGDGAEAFARGIGICAKASERGWGLVSARFTRGFGREDEPAAQQHALLERFGDVIRPREGKRLGVLSTGYAQEFNGAPNAAFKDGHWWGAGLESSGAAPPGFPKGAEGCPQVPQVNDVVDLRLELKAPENASGFAFDFDFFSSEWPVFICTKYNDGFIAYLSAPSYNGGKADNISFDARNNPVSVNNGFFDRCTPGIRLGCSDPNLEPSTCPGGPGELAGTGFGLIGDACGQGQPSTLGGATGWLFSSAPIAPGETFTLDLMLWDTGDGNLDSSVLVDNFRWIAGAVTTTTDRPVDVK
jgi:hypothetical protein